MTVADYKFGFSDGFFDGWGHRSSWYKMHLGPFGEKHVSFSARQGLTFVGLAVGLLMFSMVSAAFGFACDGPSLLPPDRLECAA